jgi:hypothetical protein
MKKMNKCDSMRISPNYTVRDYKNLDLSTEEGWQKAINIFEDRIRGRFLKFIDRIECCEFSGFIVMAIDCLLIEALKQFHEGEAYTPRYKSKEFFTGFLTQGVFSKFFETNDLAEMFYDQIRCGILHQAEIKKNSRLFIRKNIPLIAKTNDGKGIIINRKLFHKKLVEEFELYLSKLKSPNENKLRGNFKKKMDYICRISESD